MNKSSPAEMSNQISSDSAASPKVTQKPAAKPNIGKPAKRKPTLGLPAKADSAPMHAAKGNDDIMSQPQASQIGSKKP